MSGVGLGAANLLRLWRAAREVGLMLAALVAGGAFSLALSGLDPRAPPGPDSASGRSEIAIGLAFAALLASGASRPGAMMTAARRNFVFLLPPALAFVSVAWAPEPATAARRAAAFAATALTGLALAAARPGWSGMRFIARTAALGVGLSLAYAVVDPAFALHRTTDGVQSVHAGDWRGVFIHRTVLGQLSALTLAFAVHGGGAYYGRFGRLLVAGAAAICLVKARSGGGTADAGLLLIAPWALQAWRRTPGRWRLAIFGVAGLGLALSAEGLAQVALALLGKDATLTGRVPLWLLMLEAARAKLWLGYGYSTGFRDAVARMVAARSGYGYVPNAQNGYLDAVLNLGLVGLTAALAGLAFSLMRGLRLAWREGGETGPLLVALFILALNIVEAALVSANDIFVLIYVASAAVAGQMLRTETEAVEQDAEVGAARNA